MKHYWMDYRGGLVSQPKKARGVLVFQEEQLDFKSDETNFTIPIRSIVDVRVRDETDRRNVVAGAVALGVVGALIGSRSKINIMTISFRDVVGDFQHPEFALVPITRQGKAVKNADLIVEVMTQLSELRQNAKATEKPDTNP